LHNYGSHRDSSFLTEGEVFLPKRSNGRFASLQTAQFHVENLR
jgi:hypothetical protein